MSFRNLDSLPSWHFFRKESTAPQLSQSSSHQETTPKHDTQRENKSANSTTMRGLNDELDQKDFEDVDLNQ